MDLSGIVCRGIEGEWIRLRIMPSGR